MMKWKMRKSWRRMKETSIKHPHLAIQGEEGKIKGREGHSLSPLEGEVGEGKMV